MASAEIQFKRGVFLPFKAITKVHLGALETDLQEGEVVEYDGTTMKRGPEMVQLATLRAAIKVGWLVPEDEDYDPYVAKPAGVEIRPAESTGRERGPARLMGVVEDEERVVGSLDEVRGPNALPTHHAKHAGVEIGADGKARTKARHRDDRGGRGRVVSESGQEGEVVGRLRTSGKSGSIDVAKDGSRERSRIRNAKGHQHVGRGGDDLEDVLPDAASSGRPRPGIAGEGEDQETAEERATRLSDAKTQAAQRKAARLGKAVESETEARAADPDNVAIDGAGTKVDDGMIDASKATVSGGGPAIRIGDKAKVENTAGRAIDASVTVTKGSDSVGLGSDGDVVGKIGDVPRGAQPPAAQAAAPAPAPAEGEIVYEADADAADAPVEEVAPAEAAPAEATPAAEVEKDPDVPAQAIVDAKIEMIRQFVPGFDWDMNMQWAKRAKLAVEKYGENMPVINAILSIETPAVRKAIMKRLYGTD